MFKRFYYTYDQRIKLIALNAVILVVFVLWIKSINRTSLEPISGLEIVLDQVEDMRDLITEVEVESIIRNGYKNDLTLESVSRLDLKALERLVSADSRVFKSNAFLNASRKLIIDIEQRRPIARILASDGKSFYLDQLGVYVGLSDTRASRVPLITGNIESLTISDSVQIKPRLYSTFLLVMEIRKDPFMQSLIEQVHLDANGRFILIPKLGDEKIVLDYSDELAKKLSNLKAFYYNLSRTNQWSKYEEVDISISNQVVAVDLEKDKP